MTTWFEQAQEKFGKEWASVAKHEIAGQILEDCHSPELEGIRRSMSMAKEDKTDLFTSKAISELTDRIRQEHKAYMGQFYKNQIRRKTL